MAILWGYCPTCNRWFQWNTGNAATATCAECNTPANHTAGPFRS